MSDHTEDPTRTVEPDVPSPGPSAPPSRPWWRRPGPVAALVAAVVVIVVVVALVAIGDGDGEDEGDATTATTSTTAAEEPAPTTAPADQAPATAAPGGAPAEPGSASTEPDAAALEDGRHPAYLTGLDVDGGTVSFDLIQFLTGDEATEAYHREVPDDPGPPPNDYWIVNDNPRLRELPVAGDAAVTVLTSGLDTRTITLAELPAHLAGDLSPEPERIWHNPFWLTVEGGVVTALEEQYLP